MLELSSLGRVTTLPLGLELRLLPECGRATLQGLPTCAREVGLQAAGTQRDCSLSSTMCGSPWLLVLPTGVSPHLVREDVATHGGKTAGP